MVQLPHNNNWTRGTGRAIGVLSCYTTQTGHLSRRQSKIAHPTAKPDYEERESSDGEEFALYTQGKHLISIGNHRAGQRGRQIHSLTYPMVLSKGFVEYRPFQ